MILNKIFWFAQTGRRNNSNYLPRLHASAMEKLEEMGVQSILSFRTSL